MITVAIAFVIVFAVAIVAYPFFNPSQDADAVFAGQVNPVLENLVAQRDAAYSAIKDLESDHAMGKLSDADYKSLRAKYEAKAVAILRELDDLSASYKASGSAAASDDAIEREVQQLRHAAAGGSLTCPKCGTPHAAGDVFCAKCGTSLRGARCPSCGKRALPGDKFCSKCGTPI